MQENRSFDHCFGSLRGVRGFNDPRAVRLPDGNPVWVQTNAAGLSYVPFRLNIHDTNATWLGSLPHSWTRSGRRPQSAADHDRWLEAKPSGRRGCARHAAYARLLQSRRPAVLLRARRRLHHLRSELLLITYRHHAQSPSTSGPEPSAPSRSRIAGQRPNSDVDYESKSAGPPFPSGSKTTASPGRSTRTKSASPRASTDDEDAWLANFTDNPLEWFEQYRVRYSKTFRAWAARAVTTLTAELAGTLPERERRSKTGALKLAQSAANFTDESWAKLSQRDRNLHDKAFSTNTGDPAYRQLATLRYRDGDTERTMTVPKGDVLHQFREDVRSGRFQPSPGSFHRKISASRMVPPRSCGCRLGATSLAGRRHNEGRCGRGQANASLSIRASRSGRGYADVAG